MNKKAHNLFYSFLKPGLKHWDIVFTLGYHILSTLISQSVSIGILKENEGI